MSTSDLAIFGGEPVRKKPYPPHNTIIDDAEKEQVLEVLSTGHLSGFSGRAGDRFLGAEKVQEIEEVFCKQFGTNFTITLNSATSALHAAVAAAGIGPGDEVITSPYTMSASASCILHQNGIPVFADIDPDTYCIDPVSVEERITPQTRAILTVNLFGHPSDLDKLHRIAEKHKLVLIEDNAQSPGALFHGRYSGTIGKMGIFSLNYHKAIQTGEGGVVVTNDEDLANRVRLIRNHGEVVVDDLGQKELHNVLGWNYRMTELQAAVGIPQLKKLDFFNEHRQKLASVLTGAIHEFEFLKSPVVKPLCTHVYYLYTMQFDIDKIGINRKTFVQAVNAEGIPISEGYVKPLYLLPIYQGKSAYSTKGCPFVCDHYNGTVNYKKGICPITERMYEQSVITTNICRYPNTEEDVLDFAEAVQKVNRNLEKLRPK